MTTLSDLVPGAFKAQSPATLRRGWHSPPDFTRRDETPRERARSHSPGSARLDSNPAHSGAEQCPREGMRERSGGPQKVPETAPGALARKQEGSLDGYGETEAGGSREPRQRWALQGVWGGGETQPGPEPGALGAQVMGVGREGRPAHRCRWPVSAPDVPGA